MKKPMHKMTPDEHAALGWDLGSYRNGVCLALTSARNAKQVAEFIREAMDDGAEIINLKRIRESKND